ADERQNGARNPEASEREPLFRHEQVVARARKLSGSKYWRGARPLRPDLSNGGTGARTALSARNCSEARNARTRLSALPSSKDPQCKHSCFKRFRTGSFSSSVVTDD